jgi:eukaryotic-like serine/threonine-protein kinase
MSVPHVRDEKGALNVLLVDDEPALLHVTARHLRAAGFHVTECEDGPSAVGLAESATFDVLVSDIDMPGLSGIALLKQLRQRQIEIPVVLMTGAPTLDTAVQAVEHGAFKYLMKPVDPEELRDTVERAGRWREGVSTGSRRRASPESSGVLPAAEAPSFTRASIAEGVVLAERYRMGQPLGEGGMGEVWEAIQLRTGRAVAVKLLKSGLNARAEMRRRLLREARAASAVEHPNVVDVFDVFELGDGTPVLVMALLRGRTLARRLAEVGSLPVAEMADLLLPVVSAVGTAHAHGVIHRDLKPDNIFIADEGERTVVKVLDFGVAKLVSTEEQATGALTATGALVGTPGYMSPEQLGGERDVDHRADIWSIGAIVYEALTGVRALNADNIGQMLKLLYTGGIPPVSQRAPGLPRQLAHLVDRMLARERDERPHDLREVYAELCRHASTAAPAFGPPGAAKVAPTSGVMKVSTAELANARTEQGDTPAILNRLR